jgi:hypothetical protein
LSKRAAAQSGWRRLLHWSDRFLDAIRADCEVIGLRAERGVHDLRASFITICEEAGCSKLIEWVTHAPEKGVRQGYVRRVPWAPLCEEMLKIGVTVGVTPNPKSSKSTKQNRWSRRESNQLSNTRQKLRQDAAMHQTPSDPGEIDELPPFPLIPHSSLTFHPVPFGRGKRVAKAFAVPPATPP